MFFCLKFLFSARLSSLGLMITEIAVLEIPESKIFFTPQPWWEAFFWANHMSNLPLMDLENLAGLLFEVSGPKK